MVTIPQGWPNHDEMHKVLASAANRIARALGSDKAIEEYNRYAPIHAKLPHDAHGVWDIHFRINKSGLEL